MVTLTVIAGLVTAPDDGLIETVDVWGCEGDPLQPATTRITIMAPTIPRRVRNRWAAGIMNNIPIASMMKSTCRSKADGGTFMDCGGGMNAVAVICPVAVAPGDGAAAVVGTAHAESSVPGVQVKDTEPVNPPSPVMITGNVPVMPLVTPMVATETEKSHAGPVSGTVVTLPRVCVMVSEPETGPGGVAATGLKVTVTTQAAPFAAITIGKLPLLQATVL